MVKVELTKTELKAINACLGVFAYAKPEEEIEAWGKRLFKVILSANEKIHNARKGEE